MDVHENTTTSSTPSESAGTKAKILEDNESDNDGERDFDNDTFEVCEDIDGIEVSHDTKVMNCVFSYKVKTDSNVDGDEVTFVKFENQRNGSVNNLIIRMHVHDGIVCVSNKEVYEKFISELLRDFVLSSHGELEWYLGCKIIQDIGKSTFTINQEK